MTTGRVFVLNSDQMQKISKTKIRPLLVTPIGQIPIQIGRSEEPGSASHQNAEKFCRDFHQKKFWQVLHQNDSGKVVHQNNSGERFLTKIILARFDFNKIIRSLHHSSLVLPSHFPSYIPCSNWPNPPSNVQHFLDVHPLVAQYCNWRKLCSKCREENST